MTEKLISFKFTNKITSSRLDVIVDKPLPHSHFSKFANRWINSFRSNVVVCKDDKNTVEVLGGDVELEILFHAIELTRRFIPSGEERDWVNEHGLDSWVALPRIVPISWGYGFYSKLCTQIDDEVAKLNLTLLNQQGLHRSDVLGND